MKEQLKESILTAKNKHEIDQVMKLYYYGNVSASDLINDMGEQAFFHMLDIERKAFDRNCVPDPPGAFRNK